MNYSSASSLIDFNKTSRTNLFRLSYLAMKPLEEKGEDDSSSSDSYDEESTNAEKNSNDGDDELSEIDSNATAAADDDVNETFNNQETSIDDDVNGETELGTVIDISKLTLNDSSNTDSDDVINIKPKNEVNRRRIIDDDSSSDEEDSVESIDDDSDSPAKEKAASDVSNVEQEDAELDDLLLDGGFSGLNLDDPSFQGDNDTFTSFESDNRSDNEAHSVSSSDETSDDDDDDLLCFDACGCWELDKDNTGDLYLASSGPNSDVKWPKIRLPLTLYNKLFQHQRIGVQWMASLYLNEIKGGILADDMGMVSLTAYVMFNWLLLDYK